MNSFGLTDKGLIRKINQDNFVLNTSSQATMAVVCDGIGGNKAGDVASKIAAESLLSIFKKGYTTVDKHEWINQAIKIVNIDVYKQSIENLDYKGMGTTLVAAFVDDKNTYVANVGDSRCYCLTKQGKLIQITDDHTLINELVNKKGIDIQLAEKIAGRNVITRAIGIFQSVEVDIFKIEFDYKELLLCSDGLHGYVSHEVISEVMRDSKLTAKQKATKLVELANAAGGYDNITVVVVSR